MTGLSSLSPRYATEPGPIGFGLALPKGPEAKSWIWIPARRHTGMTERDRFLRFYNRLATAQLLLSHAQLPLLDAKRANSPQCISAANSPRRDFRRNSRCGSTLRNWGRSEMMVTQLVFVSFPQFRYITDDDDATRSASN